MSARGSFRSGGRHAMPSIDSTMRSGSLTAGVQHFFQRAWLLAAMLFVTATLRAPVPGAPLRCRHCCKNDVFSAGVVPAISLPVFKLMRLSP
jgi:hypothetical protein